jgi:hypothetical protein
MISRAMISLFVIVPIFEAHKSYSRVNRTVIKSHFTAKRFAFETNYRLLYRYIIDWIIFFKKKRVREKTYIFDVLWRLMPGTIFSANTTFYFNTSQWILRDQCIMREKQWAERERERDKANNMLPCEPMNQIWQVMAHWLHRRPHYRRLPIQLEIHSKTEYRRVPSVRRFYQ